MAGGTALLSLTLVSASAATVGRWSDVNDWDSTAGTATFSFPATTGFPDAALTTDSSGPAGPAAGGSTWLAVSTPPGSVYGTSRDRPYITLRPAANNASSPSTSTYTFEHPTPATGWTFTLGDIDAEYLDISAVDADGNPVPVADLGFHSSFNYCIGDGTPSCDGTKAMPVPLWDPDAGRLAGPEVDDSGDPVPGWTDTDGAAAWFEPTVSLSSLTITDTWREGFPVYQTWFGALSRDITGSVTGTTACPADDLTVTLRDSESDDVSTTTTQSDGTWSFEGLATYSDWTVTVTPPDACDLEGSTTRTADLSSADVSIGFVLEEPPAPPDPTPSSEPVPSPTREPDPAPVGHDDSTQTVAEPLVSLPDTGGPSPWLLPTGLVTFLTGVAITIGVAQPWRLRTRKG